MEEPNIPSGKLVAIDLSKSQFRGSGALYQSDRLTIGRSKFQPIEGPAQVIEKIVYQESAESQEKLQKVEGKLQESLLRFVLVAVDYKRVCRELEDYKHRVVDKSDKIFENNLAFELQRMKTEVSRLNQQLVDKEREILTVRDSEIRKSMIQAGEMSVRLMALKKENERLQTANLEKINQINQSNTTIHKLRDEHARNLAQVSNDPRVQELERIINSKDQEIRQLASRAQEADHLQRECDTLRIELSTQTASWSQLQASLQQQLSGAQEAVSTLAKANTTAVNSQSSEMAALREECLSLRAALEVAKVKERESERRVAQAVEEVKKEREKGQKVHSEAAALEEQLVLLQTTLHSLQTDKASLTNKLVASESTIRTLELGLKGMVAEKDQAQRTFSDIQSGFRHLQKERTRAQEEIDELKQHISSLSATSTSQVSSLSAQLSSACQEKNSLEREISSLKECLSVAQGCVLSLQTELKEKKDSEGRVAELVLKCEREREGMLSKEREDRDKEVQRLRKEMDQALLQEREESKRVIERLTEELREKAAKDVEEVQKLLAKKVAELEEAKSELTKANRMLQTAAEQTAINAQLQSYVTEIESQLVESSNQNKHLIEELDKAKDAIDKYSERSAALEDLRQTNALLERELREKGAKLIQIHKTLDEFQESIQRDQEAHSASLVKMKTQRDHLEKELEKANLEIERINSEIVSKLQSELLTLVSAMESAQTQITAYKHQQSDLMSHNQQLNESLTEAAKRIEQLAEEAAEFKQKSLFLEAELNSHDAVREVDQSRIAPLQTLLVNTECKLQEAESRESEARERIRLLEEEIQGLQTVSNTLKEELIQEARDKLGIQSLLDEARGKEASLKAEVQELKSSIRSMEETHDELETELRLKDAKINRSEVEINERNYKISALERELEQTLTGTVSDLSAHNARLSSAEGAVRQLEERLHVKDEVIADLERKGMLLADEVKRLVEERQQSSAILQQTVSELTKSRNREQELRSNMDKVTEELGETRSQLSSLKFKLLDIESKASVQTIGYEEMIKDKVGELESRDEMIHQLQGDLENLISKMRDEKRGWNSSRGEEIDIFIKENKRLAEELRSAREVENDLRRTLEMQEREIEKLLNRLDLFEADLTVNIKHSTSQLTPTHSKQDQHSQNSSTIKPSPSSKPLKNSRSAIQNRPKVNLQPFKDHFVSNKKYDSGSKAGPVLSAKKSPKHKELQRHLNKINDLKSLAGDSSDPHEAYSEQDDEEIKIEMPFTSFGFKDHEYSAAKSKISNITSQGPQKRKGDTSHAYSHSSSSSKNSKHSTPSSHSSSPSKKAKNLQNLPSSRVSRDQSLSLKQGSYLQGVQESAGFGGSPQYYEHHHQALGQLSHARMAKQQSHGAGQPSRGDISRISETELYKAEAEKFRLMYNDAQRALLHMHDKSPQEEDTESLGRQGSAASYSGHPRDQKVTVPLSELLTRGPGAQKFRVEGVDLEVRVQEKPSPNRPKPHLG